MDFAYKWQEDIINRPAIISGIFIKMDSAVFKLHYFSANFWNTPRTCTLIQDTESWLVWTRLFLIKYVPYNCRKVVT